MSGIRTVFFLPALTLVFWANLWRVWLSKVEDLALILSLPFLRPLTLTLIAPFLRILDWLSLFSFSVGFFAAAPAGATTMIPTATNSIATTSFLIPVTNLLLVRVFRPCQADLPTAPWPKADLTKQGPTLLNTARVR